MKIIIDKRENDLFNKTKAHLEKYNFGDIVIYNEVLQLGDVVIKTDNDEIMLIVERKTLSDLLSSIKDGRYAEQSLRLSNTNCSNHQIMYLVEGVISSCHNNEKQIIYSTITSLSLYKGFSIMKTSGPDDSAEFLLICCDKINRSIKSNKKIYDFTNTEQSTNYCDVIKSVKKDNITKENIGEIMLMQIPGISSTLAKAILSKFSSFSEFINKVNTEPGCLIGMTYESKGKERKINKSCLENIIHYLNDNSNNSSE
jgi:crossover junction endonuclease MUS81